MKTALPNRQSIRMKKWDYTSGCYFVTINTYKSQALFGTIMNGKMVLSETGQVAEAQWQKSAALRNELELDEFVIMPNHVHGIVWLKGGGAPNLSDASSLPRPQFGKPVAGALGTFVGAYKAAVTREIRLRGLARQARPIWHRNYWDVIVQDEKALAGIRNYIRFNPLFMTHPQQHVSGTGFLFAFFRD